GLAEAGLYYMLFNVERVGEITGQRRFGTHDWFNEGTRFLLDKQKSDGSWNGSTGAVVDTSYALMFLARGHAPVLMQKLVIDKSWNNRPRDVYNFVRWTTRETGRLGHWAVIGPDMNPMEMRRSPVLYAASDRPLRLDDEE